MAIGFEAFDLSGSVSVDINDADKILIRLHRTAKTADEQLAQLQKQAVTTANAFKRLGDAQNQKSAATAAKQFQDLRDNLKNIAPDQAVNQISKAKNKVNELNNELLKLKTAKAGLTGEFASGFTDRLGIGSASIASFLGNLSASAVLGVVDAVKSLALSVKDLAAQSVILAGNLEVTTNALKVFTGSTRSAKAELTEIDEVARTTAGLRLTAAREGYQQLRALGFQADIARGFIKELGEEKILSGASDDALQRIILNFAQIAAGGQTIGQELRELLTNMPTLRDAFLSAFGTLNTAQLETIKNTIGVDAFFKKLLDAMARGEAASGGFNDSLGKMQDEFIRAGQTFGEPILSPLTIAIQDLTGYINENKSALRDWGQYVGDIIEAYNNIPRFNQLPLVDPNSPNIRQAPDGRLAVRYGQAQPEQPSVLQQAAERGASLREMREQRERLARIQGRFGNLAEEGLTTEQILSIDIDKMDEEFKKAAELEKKNFLQQERQRQESLKRLEQYYERRESLTADFYRLEAAKIKSQNTFTLEEELKQIKRLNALSEQQSKVQTTETNAKFENLKKVKPEDTEKLETERQREISKIRTDAQIKEIEGAKEVQRIERQILNERRQSLIEFKDLQIREIEQSYGEQTEAIERALGFQVATAEEGYEHLVSAAFRSFRRIYELTYESYVEQLKNESLTAEQTKNIRQQMFLDLEKLTNDHNRKVLDLDDRRYQAQINRLEAFSRRQQALFESQANVFSDIGGFFEPDTFSRRSFQGFQDAFGGDALLKEVDRLSKRRLEAQAKLDDLHNRRLSFKFTDEEAKEVSKVIQRIQDLDVEINNATSTYNKFKNNVDATTAEISELGNILTMTAGAFENFDKIAEKSLFAQQDKELKAFTAQLDFANAKLRILNDQYGSELQGNVRALAAQIDSLEESRKSAPLGTTGESTLIRLKAELDDAKKAYSDFKLGTAKTGEILDAENAVRVLENSLKTLTSQQAQQRIELFSRSIAGLRQTLIDLQTGDVATQNRLQNIFTRDLLEEQIDQITEIERIKFDLANSPLFSAQDREIAQLEEIVRLRGEERARLAEKSVKGSRVATIDNFSREARKAALDEKEADIVRLTGGQAAALARIKGLQNEQAEKERILKEFAARFAKAEQDYQDKLANIKAGTGVGSQIRREAARLDAQDNSLFGGSIFGGLRDQTGLGSVDEAIFGAMDEEEARMAARKEIYKDFGNTVVGVFSQMAGAAQTTLENFILTGEGGAEVFKRLVASVIASLAVESGVKALFELAEGFAALARYDFVSASGHFAAAKLYGAVSLGAAAVGIGIGAAGGLGGGKKNQQSNQEYPGYYTLATQANQAQQQPQRQITPEMAQGQRGNVFERMDRTLEMLANELHRHQAMSAGDILTKGGQQVGQEYFANQTREGLNRNSTLKTKMAKDLGLN